MCRSSFLNVRLGLRGPRYKWQLELVALEQRLAPNAATIHWEDVRQQIDGFGASSAWTLPTMTTAQADLFFSQTNGIGLSLLRNRIAPNGTTGELSTMQMAQARGALVWSTPWSPPAAWKTNNSVTNGGSLLPSRYQDYANQLANYVQNMQAQGVNLHAISIQNEPDWVAPWESCTWTASQFHDFVAILGPTFAQRGITTKIIMPEQAGWHFELASDTLNNPATAQYISILAAHGYDGGVGPVPQAAGRRLWQTEISDFNAFDPGMNSGLTYAAKIHNFLTVAEVNAWHFWWLKSNNPTNEGLLGTSGEVTKRLYAMGNYSKFIRPGYYRIGETDDGGVLISAYKDLSTGKFVIVAVNEGGARSQTFHLNGFSTSAVTPWVTSSSLNLAQQSSVAVSGSSFTFTLSAGSVTTFVGTAGPQSPPSAPTNLIAAAGNAQVTLTWNASAGATSFNVYRSTTPNGQGATPIQTGITGTTFTNTGLTNGTTYYYKVSAVNGGGESPRSNEASATPQLSIPPAPTGLTASAGNAQVTLNWTASPGATSYNVYRSTTPNGQGATPIQTGITGTTFTNTGLTNGTTYYYKVSAVNAAGESPRSNEVSATPLASGVLVAAIAAGGAGAAPFSPDMYFSGGSTFSTSNSVNTSNVINPAPQAVYRSERYGNFTYTIPNLTANAPYLIRLHFAEIYFSTPGSRVFSISLNGSQVLSNFDIFAAAGGKDIAHIREFGTTANSNGQVIIQFVSIIDNAKVAGIEVLTAGSTSAPPRVVGTQVGNGSAQRSRVTELTVTFDTIVTFATSAAAAFTLNRNGGGAVNFSATANTIGGRTVVTLTNFAGSETQFGSLNDGRYTLTALANQISANGQALDGDGNGTAGGNYTFGDAQGLFRMFGDINGDRQVDGFDFSAFASTYNLLSSHPSFLSMFDFNGDGIIDGVDFGQFSARFGTTLP